jgi:hypothetical protein
VSIFRRIAKIWFLPIFGGLLVLLGSCNQTEATNCVFETPHPRALDFVDGELFVLEIANETNEFESGQEISMRIKNVSDSSIWFPSDLNLVVMHRIDDKTTTRFPIQSSTLPGEDIVLGNSQNSNNMFEFSFTPYIPYSPNPNEVEVYIGGYIFEDGRICPGRYRNSTTIRISP